MLDTPVDRIFFGTNRKINIFVEQLFKCCTPLKYAENSTTGGPLRVPQNSRKKQSQAFPSVSVYHFGEFSSVVIYMFILCHL